MLELTFLTLLIAALWCAKSAIIDARAVLETSVIGTVLFSILTFASFSVRPAFAPDQTVAMEPVATISGVGAVVCFTVAAMAVTASIPDATNTNDNHVR